MKLNPITKSIRAAVRDVSFQYRMGAGFAGDVNRTHPASIEPCLIDASAPPTAYGQAVLVDATTQGVRPIAAGDQSNSVDLTIYGITVRPFPFQQSTASLANAQANIGAATPPVSGVIDVLRAGYIMAQLNANVTAPAKGGRVYVWAAATSGDHVQGGFETAYSAGNTVLLDGRYTYNGGEDSTGIVEISCNV